MPPFLESCFAEIHRWPVLVHALERHHLIPRRLCCRAVKIAPPPGWGPITPTLPFEVRRGVEQIEEQGLIVLRVIRLQPLQLRTVNLPDCDCFLPSQARLEL